MVLQEGSGIGKRLAIEREEEGNIRDRSCREKERFEIVEGEIRLGLSKFWACLRKSGNFEMWISSFVIEEENQN